MKVTFAATQFACSPDAAANLARAERAVREAAGAGRASHSAAGAVRDAVFLQGPPREPFRAGAPDRGQPGRGALPGARARTRRGAAVQLLRARQQRLFQLAGHDRRRRRACSASTASRTSPKARATRRSSTSRPGDTGFRVWETRYGALGVGICWDQWFPEARALHGADGRGRAALSDRHRLRAAAMPASTPATTGSAACRATRRPTSCRWSPRTASASSAAQKYEMTVLRLLVHRRAHRREARRGGSRAAKPSSPRPSTSRRSARSAMPGACSATGAPTLRARS